MIVTRSECSQESLDPERLATAVETFRAQGYFTLEGAIPEALIVSLRTAYLEALSEKVARFALRARGVTHDEQGIRPMGHFKPDGGNHDVGRWNMHLPSRQPFLDRHVVANPFALQILRTAGYPEAMALTTIASDTPLPGATAQTIHQDSPAFDVYVNIPLVDVTEDNAPIEVWPGTHKPSPDAAPGTYDPFRPVQHSVARARELIARVPPKRLLLRAGTLLIRDMRMLHRGTAMRGTEPRPVLSLIYDRPHDVPAAKAANAMDRAARRIREFARGRSGEIAYPHLLNAGNYLGRMVEGASMTDRTAHRPIPRAEWERLPPIAQHLLRFAEIEGQGAAPHADDRTMRATGLLCLRFPAMLAGVTALEATRDLARSVPALARWIS